MVDRLVNSEENARRIAKVESCFGSSGVSLAIPGRVLVGDGVLTKLCRKRPKSRQFFLFNDILVYGNIVVNKKIYNKQHIIPLEEVSLESIEDNDQYCNGWLIRTTTKSFIVYAATSTEKQEWMAHINKCVEDLLRKSGKKPVENHAAVWVPDAEANICMCCKKTQFSMLIRRHHCRSCGAVVCGVCSSKKFLLPQQSSKPVRVCNTCYDRLSNAVKNEVTKSQTTTQTTTTSSTQNANKIVDSSGDEDSDDDTAANANEVHDHPRFYGDNNTSSTSTSTTTSSALPTDNAIFNISNTPSN